MIVSISDSYCSSVTPEHLDFFKTHGIAKPTEYKDGEETKIRWSLKFVGHIDMVPVDILNHASRYSLEFYKGVQAMTDAYIGSTPREIQRTTSGVINVHLPSDLMLTMDQVTWIEDSCTEELQRKLDCGWRILACIPRPGQRRPDYVLGMNSKAKVVERDEDGPF